MNDDLLRLIEQLEQDPFIGTPLKSGFYKIRLAIKSKGKGKRAGARVITFVKVVKSRVFLVSIYDKSDQSDTELDALLSQIPDKNNLIFYSKSGSQLENRSIRIWYLRRRGFVLSIREKALFCVPC